MASNAYSFKPWNVGRWLIWGVFALVLVLAWPARMIEMALRLAAACALIALVLLVDTPGFQIGTEAEKAGAPGRIMNFMNAMTLLTVPHLSVIIRKSYGRAYVCMGGGRHSDDIAAWPTAVTASARRSRGSSCLRFSNLSRLDSDSAMTWPSRRCTSASRSAMRLALAANPSARTLILERSAGIGTGPLFKVTPLETKVTLTST